MKLIYVAAPFTAPTEWKRSEKVQEARRWGLAIAKLGAMPLMPTANTNLFFGELSEPFWIAGALELMRRCDAAFFCPGWEHSKGCVGEAEHAAERCMPSFMALGDLAEWLEREAAKP